MIAVGQLVKFRTVVDPGDENERMRVLEVNGDRCIVEDALAFAHAYRFHPQMVYPVADLEDAS